MPMANWWQTREAASERATSHPLATDRCPSRRKNKIVTPVVAAHRRISQDGHALDQDHRLQMPPHPLPMHHDPGRLLPERPSR